ncbi:MAG: hypothetical protein BGO65_08220 [Afipia sp. 64-13]|nr:MAG: hypothetical protein BGO65_08220 [Afipia sp. 64-13]
MFRLRMFRRWPLPAMMVAIVLLAAAPAWPQTMTPQPDAAPPSSQGPALAPSEPAHAPEPPRANPGLVEELGKLLKDSASGISSSLKGSQQTIDNIHNRAKDAAGNLQLAPQTVVNGRALCPVAGNGAPDCKSAADHLCRAKGYKDGKSLDVETAEKCPAKVYLSGRTGAPGECRTENYVTRAICQ